VVKLAPRGVVCRAMENEALASAPASLDSFSVGEAF
jgi:hypothetical protein